MTPTLERLVAYFSMEIALEASMPTYSGGLGVLAGDTIRTAADLRVPMVGVTLLHRKGYFYQQLRDDGWQEEEPMTWPVDEFVEECSERVVVTLDQRHVHIRAWKYVIRGVGGFVVPVYLLDTDLPDNAEQDRTLTDTLYGGDAYYRLCQEGVLGIGGVRMLRALGYSALERFHMNEGHASLLTLAPLDERLQEAHQAQCTPDDIEYVRQHCVFTTHTPVPAGHDKFPLALTMRVLASPHITHLRDIFCVKDDVNLTHVALHLSHYCNAVSRRHGEVSRLMFDWRDIDWVTNGVHVGTWVAEPFHNLFDEYTPGWREDNSRLRDAKAIPTLELRHAHVRAKWHLIDFVNRETDVSMTVDRFTLGFARRATAYKRATLLFHDLDRLQQIAARCGPMQVVFAGKAHPRDPEGKQLIQRIFAAQWQLRDTIHIAYLENYDMVLGKLITAGVDVWLNNPEPPLEASGTSGMKAAINGVPSLSMLDGWWVEGHHEGVTGWSIGDENSGGDVTQERAAQDAEQLYEKLEHVVLPLFYHDREGFIDVMRHAIAVNGTYFNTQRMLRQYMERAYHV